MKAFAIFFLILSIFVIGIVGFGTTGSTVVNERNPCRIIDCNTPFLGMYPPEPQMINKTPLGYAVCHCPWEPPWALYYVLDN